MDKKKKEIKKKKELTMAEVTAGYEEFIKNKEAEPNGLKKFEKALKKATVKESSVK